MGESWAGMWACGWVQFCGAHGPGRQGSVEMETGPATTSPGQGLMAPGAGMRSWAMGRIGGAMGRARQGQSGLLVASGP